MPKVKVRKAFIFPKYLELDETNLAFLENLPINLKKGAFKKYVRRRGGEGVFKKRTKTNRGKGVLTYLQKIMENNERTREIWANVLFECPRL